jgi:hypothetical protein
MEILLAAHGQILVCLFDDFQGFNFFAFKLDFYVGQLWESIYDRLFQVWLGIYSTIAIKALMCKITS